MTKLHYLYLLLLLVVPRQIFANPPQPPNIQLASQSTVALSQDLMIKNYLVSEKLDGVRGYWNGKNLITRSGRHIKAPQWFTANFPNYPLDGELWIGRNRFEQISSIVRSKNIEQAKWRSVKFMVFDIPMQNITFENRYLKAKADLVGLSPYIEVIEQFSLTDPDDVAAKLAEIVAVNGEGLMLHKKSAHYQVGRNQNLVKLKPFYDAEATVIGYKPGKGKFQGMMGAVLVEIDTGKQFYIGSGFSDLERQQPPKIGSRISYKYYGLTQNGTPRFASFLRVRHKQ